ncbi:DMT family transporter [Bacillus sp. FJAT-50079]|uniref:EamA family transporter n=1 Tax=Bacillus sp. FJAT-50079 TaxID=2833577 RepID=UPI001BCA114C|nr:DMT family transporter [Bacillus sp. FJAT-50079]MBS4210407.1 DMT family transporter [Bacillus sp. FJAT-50079]
MKIWHYAAIVFLGGCSYGILSTFVKLAYSAGFSAAEVSGSQVLFGTALIWLLVLFTKNKYKRISFSTLMKLLVSGLPMGLTGIFYYKSLETVDASLAIIFLFQFVWIGTVIDWIIFKNKPERSKIISIVILLAGSILAAGLLAGGFQGLSLAGTAWGLLSACTFSIFILVSGAVANEVPAIFKSALLATGGLSIVMVIFPPLFLFHPSTLLSLAPYSLLLGFFGVVLPPLLFSIGMPHIGPGLGTILSASELPVAVIMSAIVLGEYVTFYQWCGVVLILIGIMFGNAPAFLRKRALRNG